MQFDRFLLRRYSGHPVMSYVDMFYRVPKNGSYQKQVLSQAFTRDFSIVSKNVIVTSNNPLITKELCKTYMCKREKQWITVPKHLSEVMMMDMVVLMNTYCDCKTKLQYWDIFYFVPAATPTSVFRQAIQHTGDGDDEEDLSLKP